MRFVNVVWFALVFVCSLASAQDQSVALRPMTLEECIRLAIENNFNIQVERLSPEIARFNLESAYAYYVPNFEASVIRNNSTRETGGINTITGLPFPQSVSENDTVNAGVVGVTPWGLRYDFTPDLTHSSGTSRASPFDYYQGTAGITLRQPLLRDFLIDAGRQNILLAKNDIKTSETALLDQIMDIVSRVEQAYFDLIFARESIKVQQAGLDLAERLVQENRRKVEVGTLAPLDEKQAESQAAIARADLLSARQSYDREQNALKNLITDKYLNWHGVDIDPAERLIAMPVKFDVAESWERGLKQRPDLQRVRLELERRDITLRYLRNQIYPAIDLVGSYGNNGIDPNAGGVFEDITHDRNPFYSVGVVVSFPLSTRGPRNAYNANKAEKQQAILRAKQLEQIILVEIDDSIKLAQTSFQRVEATRRGREYAEAALNAEQRKLEAGRSTSFVVLQLQRDLTEARSREIRALADYNKALSLLARSEGETLHRANIDVR